MKSLKPRRGPKDPKKSPGKGIPDWVPKVTPPHMPRPNPTPVKGRKVAMDSFTAGLLYELNKEASNPIARMVTSPKAHAAAAAASGGVAGSILGPPGILAGMAAGGASGYTLGRLARWISARATKGRIARQSGLYPSEVEALKSFKGALIEELNKEAKALDILKKPFSKFRKTPKSTMTGEELAFRQTGRKSPFDTTPRTQVKQKAPDRKPVKSKEKKRDLSPEENFPLTPIEAKAFKRSVRSRVGK